jgi:hypothetical protein
MFRLILVDKPFEKILKGSFFVIVVGIWYWLAEKASYHLCCGYEAVKVQPPIRRIITHAAMPG